VPLMEAVKQELYHRGSLLEFKSQHFGAQVWFRCTTQSAIISSAASQAEVAATASEEAKDNQYLDIDNKSGGNFITLVCESFGAWAPSALSTLFRVADRLLKMVYPISLLDDNYCSNFLSPCDIIILK